MHTPQNVKGEQLVAQLFRNIPEKSWLFKYGRVPMSFIMGEWIWEVCAKSWLSEYFTNMFPACLREPQNVSALQSQRHRRSDR